jgi:integrase
MSRLGQALDDYLALRRSLGYKLERAESLLSDFIRYVEAKGCSLVTTKLALDWAALTDASPNQKAKRLSLVRGFAKHLHAFDSRTEIPSPEIPSQDLLPYRRKRRTPYLYSEQDIKQLMKTAGEICTPLKACTYTTLIGLLVVTGMRLGEAIALDRADIDWCNQLLVVWEGKFGKSRELPLHATTIEALSAYARQRDQVFEHLTTSSFFVSMVGKRLDKSVVHKTFLKLLRRAGLSERLPRQPHLHDLRHHFAIKTLLGWYKAGLDVESRLPLLSTYLGHVNPTNTYWYLTATPELLRLAAERRQRIRGDLP